MTVGVGVGSCVGVVADGLGTGAGVDGLVDGRGALDEGCGVGNGGAGMVDVGVGVDEGDDVGLVEGDPELVDGLGVPDGMAEGLVDGVPETELEGDDVPGVGVTSARAGMASDRQIAAVNAATALRRKT
ncbi:MAG: hypothetical protein WCP81_02085 [Actinomycetes bacterium]|jgi:hypothetical protein